MTHKILLIAITLFTSSLICAQTPGSIVKYPTSTGRAVLDPDFNGYVSRSSSGFVSNDESESEIPYIEIPGTISEPISDPLAGPNCSFVDIVTSTDESSVYYYLNASNNLLVRFRLGGYSPNSKGYSLLLDTDQKIGFSGPNADPNAVTGNPGFEIEISLQTNFGVYLYNVDGLATGVQKGSALPYDDYCMKSVALTTNCGDADYFYDFYIPFSMITTYFPSITTSTPLRMAATTVMNPSPAMGGTLADIGGIGGGNPDALWTTLIENYPPTGISGTAALSDRTTCPDISATVATGATSVSGTSTEANGTTIKVFKNGSLVGTTTVSGGSWTLSGISPALAAADVISASATATGRAESISNCDLTTVGAVCTAPVTSATHCGKSIQGVGTPGAKIYVYQGTSNTYDIPTSGTVWTSGQPVTATTTPSTLTPTTDNFLHKCTGTGANTACNASGAACLINGAYRVTQQLGSECVSAPVWVCVGALTATATPTISTTITTSTTSVSGTVPAPDNVAGVTVYLYKNSYQIGTTTTTVGGAWTISSLSFAACDVVKALAIQTTTPLCPSAYSISQTVASTVTTAPVISSTYCATAPITSVSGTSIESNGTVIQVYENGVAEGSTTTVTNGAWTASTGISIALGSIITAKATNSGGCKSISAASSGVTVGTKTTNAVTISGTVKEGDLSVSGTGTTGDVIKLYEDGTNIGGTAIVALGVWTIAGLSATTLYSGGILTATAQTVGKCESDASASKTIQCIVPVNTPSLTPIVATICSGQTVTSKISSSQADVIYQFYNGASSSGGSVTGTGGTISLKSAALTASTTLTVKASKLSPAGCTNTLLASVVVTVNPASACNRDSDGLLDLIDLDSDNDGIPNALETGTTTYNPAGDVDVDGIYDYIDNDGWSHCCIANPGFPAWTDADANGVNDLFDKDGDKIPDFLDLDSDNDGVPDCVEAAGTDANRDGIIDGFTDTNLDGLANSVDPASGGTPLSVPDTDGDGLKNYKDLDSDGDGIPDLKENNGTDANNDGKIDVFADTDNDGMADVIDPTNGGTALSILNSDNIGNPNYMDLDSDNDGIFDIREADISIPVDKDASNDGKLDVTTDANGDGLADALVSSPLSLPDTDGDGVKDYMDSDSDNDGLKDYLEGFDDDNSGASLNDYIARGIASGKPAYANIDANGNGYPNFLEDADNDGIPNFLDSDNATYYLDSDGDGIVDLFDVNSSGANASKPFPDKNGNGVPSFREVADNIVLPIELIEFYGENTGFGNTIYWTTASEINNDYFTLEHSTNGIRFIPLCRINGAGYSEQKKSYKYVHEHPPSTVNYYRLKQTDFDKKCKHFKTISINPDPAENAFRISTDAENRIRIDMSSAAPDIVSVQLLSTLGTLVLKEEHLISEGSNCFFIHTSGMTTGVYYLHIFSETKNFTGKAMIGQ